MANKSGGPLSTLFQKGSSGNKKGRPKNQFSKIDVKRAFGDLIMMTPIDLAALAQDPDAPVLEHWVASIIMKGTSHGDTARFRFLLEVAFGRDFDLTPIDKSDPASGYQQIMADLKKLKENQ